jgi:cell division protein FtsX
LTDVATESQVNEVKRKLESSPDVRDLRYQSKEDALAQAREMMPEESVDPSAGPNPFPASVEVTLAKGSSVEDIRTLVEGDSGVGVIQGEDAKRWRC